MSYIDVGFNRVRRIIHIADIHIRLLNRHGEYRQAFATLFDEIAHAQRDETVIVVAGDIVHSKTDLSPEMVDLATYFLTECAELAPTLVIAGNHDLLVTNRNRLDALSPICANISNPYLHYLKESGVYTIGDTDFAVMSLIGSPDNWPTAADCKSDHKIALFHGPVLSATTDVGYVVESKHYKCEMFDGFDMALLGDIHRHQVLQEYNPTLKKPSIVFPSSLIQQNHGELISGHGWLEWDVPKRTFKFHDLKNKFGYYTLRVEDGVVPDYSDMPTNVRLRIFAGDMDQSDIKNLVTEIRKIRTIEELAITNFSGKGKGARNLSINSFLDLNEIGFQNKLINDYVKESFPDLEQDVVDNILELNTRLNSQIEADDLARNVIWKPISLRFSNLFTYGDDNSIDFNNIKGVAGIFAPNATGKTSVAEAICFALYDRTPRTIKASSIMNRRKTDCSLEFKFEVNGKIYVIERKGKKNKKGEVKIDVDFYRVEGDEKVSLNGEERRYTNTEIRKLVGDYEDFILTTFSSSAQTGLFMDKGQSDRKDLLSQFMGLNIFDKLHTIANEEIKEIAVSLKRFKQDDFTQQLVDTSSSLAENKKMESDVMGYLDTANLHFDAISEQIQTEYSKQRAVKTQKDIKKMDQSKRTTIESIDEHRSAVESLGERIQVLTEKLEKANVKIKERAQIPTRYEAFVEDKRNFDNVDREILALKKSMKSDAAQLELLKRHKYDPNCEYCILNGKTHIEGVLLLESRINESQTEINEKEVLFSELKASLESRGDVFTEYSQYQSGLKWVNDNTSVLRDMTDKEKKHRFSIEVAEKNLELINREIEEYEQSRADIEFNSKLAYEISELELKKKLAKITCDQLLTKLNLLKGDIAWESRELDNINAKIKTAKEYELKYSIYETYLAAICRDGLPYKLIAEILPELQMAVNNILNQIVPFSLVFEMDGKNVNMFLSYDEEKTWPLELASGMEKFISSLAIRVALTSLSSLPKSNFLIIDEGLGALDGDTLGSIFGLFDVLKTQFNTVFLITHVESVKDVADVLIEIERNEGYSRIKV